MLKKYLIFLILVTFSFGEDNKLYNISLGLFNERFGYDIINIAFDDSGSMNVINNLVKELFIGFVVVEQSNKGCVLRNISKDCQPVVEQLEVVRDN